MPRNGQMLSSDEIAMFHQNFNYMWRKLGLSYYLVKGSRIKDVGIPDSVKDILPSYAICAKCANDASYSPSRFVLSKIVRFYNELIAPPTDEYEFLHKDLSTENKYRYVNSNSCDPRFVGIYQCYYPSVTEKRLVGGYLKIAEEGNHLQAILVQGMRSDEAMRDPNLLNLIAKKRPYFSDFQELQAQFPDEANEQRYSFFEGKVDLTERALFVYFRCNNRDQKKIAMTLNLSTYHPGNPTRHYIGGLAFMLASSDGPFDSRFYQMALANYNKWDISMDDPELRDIITPQVDNLRITLTDDKDTRWFVYVVSRKSKSEK